MKIIPPAWEREQFENIFEDYPDFEDITDENLLLGIADKYSWEADGYYNLSIMYENRAEAIRKYIELKRKRENKNV